MLKRILATDVKSWIPMSLRLALGAIFIAHGAQKLFGWFGGYGLAGTAGFFEEKLGMSPGLLFAGLAGAGEFFGGLLILLGGATRLGALTVGFTMLVAILKVHWGSFFLPSGIEFTLALLAAAVTLVIAGGGALSLDAVLFQKTEPKGSTSDEPVRASAEVVRS